MHSVQMMKTGKNIEKGLARTWNISLIECCLVPNYYLVNFLIKFYGYITRKINFVSIIWLYN